MPRLWAGAAGPQPPAARAPHARTCPDVALCYTVWMQDHMRTVAEYKRGMTVLSCLTDLEMLRQTATGLVHALHE